MKFLAFSCLALVLGGLLDFCFGDPHWMLHPVQIIGKWISFLEAPLRKAFPDTPGGQKAAGGALTVLVLAAVAGVCGGLLWVCWQVSPWLYLALETFWCYQIPAARSLKTESMKVYRELKQGDLQKARQQVSMIVGRDTQRLNEEQVAKAAVETVAENTSDGIVAPVFYLMLGGSLGGMLYKSVNTMDSMVGYRNERYLYYGRCAAKLDDLLNFIPSRLSALLMILSAKILSMDAKGAARIWRRDRFCHDSPNSAQTESACAGALGVQLAGDAWYFGKLKRKPTIGDALRSVEPEDIVRANRLMYLTSALSLAAAAAVRLLVYWGVF